MNQPHMLSLSSDNLSLCLKVLYYNNQFGDTSDQKYEPIGLSKLDFVLEMSNNTTFVVFNNMFLFVWI